MLHLVGGQFATPFSIFFKVIEFRNGQKINALFLNHWHHQVSSIFDQGTYLGFVRDVYSLDLSTTASGYQQHCC